MPNAEKYEQRALFYLLSVSRAARHMHSPIPQILHHNTHRYSFRMSVMKAPTAPANERVGADVVSSSDGEDLPEPELPPGTLLTCNWPSCGKTFTLVCGMSAESFEPRHPRVLISRRANLMNFRSRPPHCIFAGGCDGVAAQATYATLCRNVILCVSVCSAW